MMRIDAAVGIGQPNHRHDVCTIQNRLNAITAVSNCAAPLAVDGIAGKGTIARIKEYQASVVRLRHPDGIISPAGITLRHLSGLAMPGTSSPSSHANHTVQHFSEPHYLNAAQCLGCDIAAIKAVAMIETSARGPFDEQGRPVILFERHYFHKLTQGKYAMHGDISSEARGAYGKYSEQYPKLHKAMSLDRAAALRSASWGAFQIMGDNYAKAGFADIEPFTQAMNTLEGQMSGFTCFIKSSPSLLSALRDHHWEQFARVYNGPDYKTNHYHTRIAHYYERLMHA
ncbi:N-acetylmuramidase family protein [Sodalis sp. RH21]|uniref:N-acetylmuramidase family protein n=1 Tax=unclassified Sodalis (in: enterobacteria) TaxID=2636512 RepID=UPI0039B39DE4